MTLPLKAKYLRFVRTIVIEGPEDWVRGVQERCYAPAPETGGLMGTDKRVLCASAYTEAADEPLDWRTRCVPCDGRGYVSGGEGCVSERCPACGGTGKVMSA